MKLKKTATETLDVLAPYGEDGGYLKHCHVMTPRYASSTVRFLRSGAVCCVACGGNCFEGDNV